MLLKHVELGKEDADVIHQSVLEVDETASKDLRSNASRRTCTGSEPKVLEANRRSATQAMIARPVQKGPAQGQNQVPEANRRSAQAMIARPKVQKGDRGDGVRSSNARIDSGGLRCH